MTIQETIKTIDEPSVWLEISPSDIRNLNDYCKKIEKENKQLILLQSSLQFNGKYKADFDNWLKDQSIEINEEGIFIDEERLVDGDTILDFYECKTKSV